VVPDGGKVTLGDVDVTSLPLYRRARMGLGYLPQDECIFQKLSVRDNFLAILETMPGTRAEREAKADALIAEFGLQPVTHSMGASLSGGERRRAEIARGLIPGPGFMLFDEPFAGVDPISVHELQRQIAALKDRGLGVLITDHNVRDTLRICDRAYLITKGQILEQGSPQALAQSERARREYLGQDFKLD
jgi:lipopolysaccharide export system ATP-binding protein